jgi:F-type H+-transporting ATPase subunit b
MPLTISSKNKSILKIILFLYGVFLILFLINVAHYWGKREISEEMLGQNLEAGEEIELPVTGGKIYRGDLIDEDAYNLLVENGLEGREIKVYGHGAIIGPNATAPFVLLNLIILVVVLHEVGWKRLIKILDERVHRIKSDLDSAKQTREKAQATLSQYTKQMAEARKERSGLIEDGRRLASEESQKIVTQAKGQAEALLERAQEELAAQETEARKKLSQQIGEISASLAEKILAREIDKKTHQKLVDEFLSDLKEKKEL